MIDSLFDTVENVSTYKFCEDTFEKWIIESISSPITYDNKAVYLAIDLVYPAIGHWIFESAIFLPYFNELKIKYPGIKLHLNVKRNFKLLFCKLFDIEEDRISYNITVPNTFLFAKPVGSLNKKRNDPIHRKLIYDFFITFLKYIPYKKNIYNDIVLPRQIKENLAENDSYEGLLYTINTFKEKNKKFLILNTDYIVNIQDQINILSHCKNIILVDGSALLLNVLFVKGKAFHIPVRHMTQEQSAKYPQMKYILECAEILHNNTIHYYPSEKDFCKVYCQ
jgi:hypothetical protein